MKIEMAESLLYSYLKHKKDCRIVQCNWAPSSTWKIQDNSDKKLAKTLFNNIKNNAILSNIFKDNSFDQLLKQAEIDVLGIDLIGGHIYGLDVAFHSGGLNYGAKEKNSETVVKKILRTIFILQCYFHNQGVDKFHSYFITPKTGATNKTHLQNLINETKLIVNKTTGDIDGNTITIKFITNEDFFSEIVHPVIESTANEHDTSELFARSIKLLNLEPKKSQLNLNKKSSNDKDGMKIGQFVKEKIQYLFEENMLTNELITLLQNRDYSKEKFNQNWSILREASKGYTDENGYGRYYTSIILGKKYYLTSQWFEKHSYPFNNWLKENNF